MKEVKLVLYHLKTELFQTLKVGEYFTMEDSPSGPALYQKTVQMIEDGKTDQVAAFVNAIGVNSQGFHCTYIPVNTSVSVVKEPKHILVQF
jgi:hypothetical protein